MDILEEVNNLIAESEFAKAKHKLLQIMAENGTTLASTKLLGLVNVNLGCYDEARQNFEEVVETVETVDTPAVEEAAVEEVKAEETKTEASEENK